MQPHLFSYCGLAALTLVIPVGCGSDVNKASDCRDTLHADADGDGYGDPDVTEAACPGDGWVDDASDCDDADVRIHPDAPETCDEIDNDCSGAIDDGADIGTWYPDADGDLYGADEGTIDSCEQPAGFVSTGDDCDDADPAIFPGAKEIVGDGIDNDCNPEPLPEVVDASTMWVATYDGAGPDSILSQACAGTNDAGQPVITLLDEIDGYVATSPFVRDNINFQQLDHVALDDRFQDNLNLTCAPDMGAGPASETLVGSPEASLVQLVYGDLEGASTTFDNDGAGEVGYAVTVLEGELVLGDGATETVILVRDEFEPGTPESSANVANLVVQLDAPLRSLDGSRDLTGDGIDDLVAGAKKHAYVIDGASMLDGDDSVRVVLTLDGQHDSFGETVRSIPDSTGDGVSDLLVADLDDGAVYLIPGKTYGEYPVEDVAVVTFEGKQNAGIAMTAIEVAGDGAAGFAIGMPETDQVALYRSADLVEAAGETYELDESSANTVINGESGSDFGTTLTSGDLTADGYVELIIGAPGSDGDRGRVYVISTQR